MRILKLDLIRFGAFQNTVLDFSPSQGTGLHLIVGPNEAGKSTARKALHCALFGFPQRVTHAHGYEAKHLRVDATLADAHGATHAFVRRRGNKDTVLDPASDKPIDDLFLTRWLASVGGQSEFEHAFALGHEELRAGGNAILNVSDDPGGNVSKVMAISSGLHRLNDLRRDFQSEAEDLFKPRGSKQPINEALKELKTAQDQLREIERASSEYLKLEKQFHQVTADLNQLQSELSDARCEQSRLERWQRALPLATKYRTLSQELAELGDLPPLDDEFTTRRIATEQRIARFSAEAKLHAADLAQEDANDETLVDQDLLAAEQEIITLHGESHVHIKAQADAQRMQTERDAQATLVENRLRDLGRQAADLQHNGELLPRTAEKHIRSLAQSLDALHAEHERLAQERKHLTAKIADLETTLEGSVANIDLNELKPILRQAARDRDLDRQISETQRSIAQLESDSAAALPRLTGWSGPIETLLSLVPPSREVITRFQQQFDALDQRQLEIRKQQQKQRTERSKLERKRDALTKEHDLPSQNALDEARQDRDHGWQLIQTMFENRSDSAEIDAYIAESNTTSLAEAFQAAMERADRIADQLRTAADAISQRATFNESIAQIDIESRGLDESLAQLELQQTEQRAQWEQAWSFLDEQPGNPTAMLAWHDQFESLRQIVLSLQESKHNLTVQTDRRNQHRQRILDALAAMPTSVPPQANTWDLEDVLNLADEILETLRTQQQAQLADQRDLNTARAELTQLESNLASHRQTVDDELATWADRLKEIELSADTATRDAIDFVDTLAEIDQERHSLHNVQQRIEDISRDRNEFFDRIGSLIQRVAPNASASEPIEALTQVHKQLLANQTAAAQHTERDSRRKEKQHAHNLARQQLEAAHTELEHARHSAGCNDSTEIERIEANVRRGKELDHALDELQHEIAGLAGGETLEDFLNALEGTHIDQVTADLGAIEGTLSDLNQRKDSLSQELGRLQQLRSAFDGESQATEIATQIAELQERVLRDATRYAHARMALRLLSEARDRYYQKSGNDLLSRASDIFAELTCGAFQELRTEFGEDDSLSIVGLRSNAADTVGVAGMSDGTRDQLYLALRLAWLHLWLDRNEPLPVLMDDLLIHFDDERSTAALKQLDLLADRTQVLFFTHHDHLYDLACAAVTPERFHSHRLPRLHAPNTSPIPDSSTSASGQLPLSG